MADKQRTCTQGSLWRPLMSPHCCEIQLGHASWARLFPLANLLCSSCLLPHLQMNQQTGLQSRCEIVRARRTSRSAQIAQARALVASCERQSLCARQKCWRTNTCTSCSSAFDCLLLAPAASSELALVCDNARECCGGCGAAWLLVGSASPGFCSPALTSAASSADSPAVSAAAVAWVCCSLRWIFLRAPLGSSGSAASLLSSSSSPVCRSVSPPTTASSF